LVAGVNRGPLEDHSKIKIMLEKTDVEGLLKGTVSLSGCDIKVGVSKSKLTLTGMVHSLDQKGEAERIAWKALGVWTVSNELVIEA
jgi:osmotically-inducible protein OsmY